eukprot:1384075-Amorphochlora_amoeboformis.AAC.2
MMRKAKIASRERAGIDLYVNDFPIFVEFTFFENEFKEAGLLDRDAREVRERPTLRVHLHTVDLVVLDGSGPCGNGYLPLGSITEGGNASRRNFILVFRRLVVPVFVSNLRTR